MCLIFDFVFDGLFVGIFGMMNDYCCIVCCCLLLIFLLVLLIVVLLLFDFMFGFFGLLLQSLWQMLIDLVSVDLGMCVIVWDICLFYVVMVIIVGLVLGLVGVEMQIIFNNLLVSLFIFGVFLVVVFGVVLVIVFGIGLFGIFGQWFILVNVFIFVLLVVLLLDGIICWIQVVIFGVILFGIVLVFIFNVLVLMLQFIVNEDMLQGLVFWIMGSIDCVFWSKVVILLVVLVLVMFLLLCSVWKLIVLWLGEDWVISFGINVCCLCLIMLLWISILLVFLVVFVGLIGFIGLVVLYIVWMFFGEDYCFYLFVSVLIGVLVFFLVFIVLKNLILGVIILVGIVIFLVGVLFFLSIILCYWGQV